MIKLFLSASFVLTMFIANAQRSLELKTDKKLTNTSIRNANPTLPDPTITSPSGGSTLSGPFVIAGKAKPNATVKVSVIPASKGGSSKPLLVTSYGKEFKRQDFTVTANASGQWQAPMTEVKFHDGTTDRKITIFCSQELGPNYSKGKNTAYKAPQIVKFVPVVTDMTSFSIKTPAAQSIVKSNGPITGTASKGTVVKVVVMSAYYLRGEGPRKGPTQEFYATAGADGKWKTETVNFNVNKMEQEKSTYTITATVEGSSSKKEITVTNPQTSTVATSSFRVLGPTSAETLGSKPFKIHGVGETGSKIVAVLKYTGTSTYEYNAPGPFGDTKKETSMKNKDFGTYEMIVDVNGEWSTPTILSKKITPGYDPDNEKTTVIAFTIVAEISLVDNDGKRLKTEKLSLVTMPMNYK